MIYKDKNCTTCIFKTNLDIGEKCAECFANSFMEKGSFTNYEPIKISESCETCKFKERSADEEPCSGCESFSCYEMDAEKFAEYHSESKTDEVKEPAHYKNHEFECIDEMIIAFGKDAVITFCVLNAWKYRNRAGSKGNAETDLKKSDEYLRFAYELLGEPKLLKNAREAGAGISSDLLNPAGKYAVKFARNHGMTIEEALSHPMVQARFDFFSATGK